MAIKMFSGIVVFKIYQFFACVYRKSTTKFLSKVKPEYSNQLDPQLNLTDA